MSQKISVLLIAQNAEIYLKRCLDSLTKFDEVVFVDGGSTDRSVDIAKSYDNVVVYENPWPGFIEQRNFSLKKASHEWCFMIDADEALAPNAFEEITRIVNNNPDKVLYRIVRTEYYLGKELENCYGQSDYQERLFLRDRITYTGGTHHEHLIDGKSITEMSQHIGDLAPEFRVLHDDTYGLHTWIKKLPRFSIYIANEKLAKNKKTNAFIVLLSFIGTFFQIFFKTLRLGRVGFIISVQTALYRCLVKLIIYEDQYIEFDKKMARDNNLG